MRQEGVAIGLVTDVDDPGGEGRVRLEYPWLPGGPPSTWIPVASPLAGGDRGLWFMPEVGDEVLVGFEHGDFDHPYVLGYLWNGVDRPPDTDVKHRVLVTPGGHELRFEDNDGGKRIVLKTAGGHELTLSDASGAVGVTVRTSGGHRLEMDDTGSAIKLQSAGQLKLEMSDTMQSIELSGGGRTVAMRAGQFQIT